MGEEIWYKERDLPSTCAADTNEECSKLALEVEQTQNPIVGTPSIIGPQEQPLVLSLENFKDLLEKQESFLITIPPGANASSVLATIQLKIQEAGQSDKQTKLEPDLTFLTNVSSENFQNGSDIRAKQFSLFTTAPNLLSIDGLSAGIGGARVRITGETPEESASGASIGGVIKFTW